MLRDPLVNSMSRSQAATMSARHARLLREKSDSFSTAA
jgi:hypothetical protein